MALTLLEAVLLGALQGLTEWLPVSSSGHLVLARHWMGVEVPLLFDLVLHLGTLVVVVLFYRARVAGMIRAVLRAPATRRAAGSWRGAWRADADLALAGLVVLGTVPTVLLGLALRDAIEDAYASTLRVGVEFVLVGIFLFATRYARPRRAAGDLTARDALVVGVAQGVAIFPAVSRSGATIGAALFRGVEPETAARYSFLLSIPAILGATVLQATDDALAAAAAQPVEYAVGALVSGVVGYATLALLVYVVKKRGFHHFAWYCIGLGAIAIATSLA